ncbi:MAG: VWA domain-containing protein [Kiritimatiellae bacterium]|nr:VWA domain-containing protein [Kiritimatiellia bacterium]
MTFASPGLLFLLPLALLALRKKRRFRAIEVSSLAGWRDVGNSRRIRWLWRMRWVRAAVVALLIIALAAPEIEQPVEEVVRQGIAIEMLVDISSSMESSIAGGGSKKRTRMEAALKEVESFVQSRPDDLIGLITFARYADTVSPLTFGHRALLQLVRGIEIQNRPNEDGTAYGDALALACAQLEQMSQWQSDGAARAVIESRIVVLLTDGENNCGLHLPQEAAGLARRWGIRVYVISLGDSAEAWELNDAERLLESVAESTGGAFWKSSDGDSLAQAYREIDQLEKSAILDSTVTHNESIAVFHLFLLPALLLMLSETALGATLLHVNQERAV